MNRAALHEGLRRMRFESVLDRQERGEITQADAAEMLGIHERTFRRWRDRFTEEGEPGLADRRLGKPSSHRAAAEEIARMLGLFRTSYGDFTVKHFHAQLVKRHIERHGAISVWILDGEPEKANGWVPFARRTAFQSTAPIRSA